MEVVAEQVQLPVVSLKLICHAEESRPIPPFQFDPIERDLFDGVTVKIGRQVNKNNGQPNLQNSIAANKDCIWFKSKVVSRSHAEMWVRDGQVCLHLCPFGQMTRQGNDKESISHAKVDANG